MIRIKKMNNLEQFLDEGPVYNPTVDGETRKRIRLSVAAYAYEYLSTPVMDDAEFDELARSIDLNIDTRRPDLDAWFRKNFQPHTGMWIRNHPEKNKLEWLARLLING